ncbi:MAG: magnesium chelatase subunit H [Chloroflexales bacterium]|nr:magnesium chelatase subunit H [Chloroflexales bacterium]
MHFIVMALETSTGVALQEAAVMIRRDHGIELNINFYNAPSLKRDEDWQRLEQDLLRADFVLGSMLFGEEYVRPLERLLAKTSAPVCMIMSNPVLIRSTRIGKFVLKQRDDESAGKGGSPLQRLMRAFRPKHGHGEAQRQMALVRGMSKMLKYLPGKARDLHSYIAIHQYWTHSSPENLRRMLCMLIERYVPGYKGRLPIEDPLVYPDAALFHPDAAAPFESLEAYQKWRAERNKAAKRHKTKFSKRPDAQEDRAVTTSGTVGLLTLRALALSGKIDHLAQLTRALETRGLEVRMAYSAGLDGRKAIEKFFIAREPHSAQNVRSTIDILVTTTGFALVGGPAASQPDQALKVLDPLDVPFVDLIPLVFQRVEDWQHDDRGLLPVQLAMNIALPELDGAIEPWVYSGPSAENDTFLALPRQIELAAERIARIVALRCKPHSEKKIAIVLFSFPPTLGNVGTAAYLDVFASIYRLLQELHSEGYNVELPASAEALRQALVEGNALVYGTDGNVADRLTVEDYRRLFPAYVDTEPYWGSAPGELLNDGKSFYILGRHFGNVFVGIQPSFGYERDPMRLLMAKDAAPHHGFAAFYTWLDKVFGADAVLHFGTHGALEFMPGKQAGLAHSCWPARLLGSLPNFYYYCVNNPSEGSIAKRRSAATLISYMVPPVQNAGLYKGLRLLKDSIDRYRQQPDPELLEDIRLQAERLEIGNQRLNETNDSADAQAPLGDEAYVAALANELLQIEQRMIPVGLHVLGTPPAASERADILGLVAAFARPDPKGLPLPHLVAHGLGWDYANLCARLKHDPAAQQRWEQVHGIVREAINRFVDLGFAADNPVAKFQALKSVDEYLHTAAQIRPGTLKPLWDYLGDLLGRIVNEQEIEGLLRALRGGYIPPSPGNDVVRNPAVVPTGRNIHGLDPFHIPSPMAQTTGARLVAELLERSARDQGELPETVAIVLWGTDNLKTDGEGIAQTLALLGARVILDELGRVADIELIPLAELGRPRIDVVVTVSGIFRDLMAHQVALLDKAARLTASADEPAAQNFVRKHALAQAAELGISLDEAAARVFSNAPGSYGANVNHLVESSTWEDEQQLSDAFMNRKSFAFDTREGWCESRSLLASALATVDVTFQNIDSVELGISDIDHYYEYLGGVTKSVESLRGKRPPVLVSEAFAVPGGNRVQSLEHMVRLESRAKLLNPKWFEGMLAHGYEGVREIETRVSNTFGWSATASAVEGWVYQGVANTYLLDETMRERLAQLNPHAAAAMAGRLLEANSRGFWEADESTLEALRDIYSDLEDRLEGIAVHESGA